MEMTFAMIKPNGVKSGLIGRILDRYTSARLSVVGLKLHQMTSEEARGFYAEHVNKPFFPELEAYMTKGPSVMLSLVKTQLRLSAQSTALPIRPRLNRVRSVTTLPRR